jgi:hypothetical protein
VNIEIVDAAPVNVSIISAAFRAHLQVQAACPQLVAQASRSNNFTFLHK